MPYMLLGNSYLDRFQMRRDNDKLHKRVNDLEGILKETRDAQKELLEFTSKNEERAYNRAKAELQAKAEAAAGNADQAGVRQAMTEMDALDKPFKPQTRPVTPPANVDPTIQDWIEEGKLSAGHGRALLAVLDPQLRMRYAQRAARGGLTVRQIERLASRHARGRREKAEIHVDPNVSEALDELQRHLGTKIFLRQRTKVRPGQLVLEYYEDAQLMGLYDRLMK
jgi:ParB family chromosome partitioning protein